MKEMIDTTEGAETTEGTEMIAMKGMIEIKEVAGMKEETMEEETEATINQVVIAMKTVKEKNQVIFYVNSKVMAEISEGLMTLKEVKTEIQGPNLLAMTQEGTKGGRMQLTKSKAEAEAILMKRGHHERKYRAQSQDQFQKNDQQVHAARDHQARGDRGLPAQGDRDLRVQEKTTDQGLRQGLRNKMTVAITDWWEKIC